MKKTGVDLRTQQRRHGAASAEQRRACVAEYEKGERRVEDIAAGFGVSIEAVYLWIKREGGALRIPHSTGVTPGQRRIILERARGSSKLSEIAEASGVSDVTVRKVLKGEGVPVPRKPGGADRRRYVDESFFYRVDEEPVAYTYGLLLADGHVSKWTVAISLQERDTDLLRDVQRVWGGSGMIRPVATRNPAAQNQMRLRVNSIATVRRLEQLGLANRKSFDAPFPLWMPLEMHRHFIRGVFDGDGSLTVRRARRQQEGVTAGHLRVCWKIIGSRSTILGIAESVRIHLGVELSIRQIECDGGTLHECSTSAQDSVFRICDWMYEGATIRLERKYQKFVEGRAETKRLADARPRYRKTCAACGDTHLVSKGFCKTHRSRIVSHIRRNIANGPWRLYVPENRIGSTLPPPADLIAIATRLDRTEVTR